MKTEKSDSFSNILVLISSLAAAYASFRVEQKKAKALRWLVYLVAGLYLPVLAIIVLLLMR